LRRESRSAPILASRESVAATAADVVTRSASSTRALCENLGLRWSAEQPPVARAPPRQLVERHVVHGREVDRLVEPDAARALPAFERGRRHRDAPSLHEVDDLPLAQRRPHACLAQRGADAVARCRARDERAGPWRLVPDAVPGMCHAHARRALVDGCPPHLETPFASSVSLPRGRSSGVPRWGDFLGSRAMSRIRPCRDDEQLVILATINASAAAYRGAIAAARLRE